MSKLLKISIAVVVLAVLALVQSPMLEEVPSPKRYKIYRLEIGILISLSLCSVSKYMWKRLVEEVVRANLLRHSIISAWRYFIAFILAMVHLCPLTVYNISKEPSYFNIISWTCLGIYTIFLFMMETIKLTVKQTRRFLPLTSWTPLRQTAVAVLITFAIVSSALVIGNRPPQIVKVEISLDKLPPSMDNFRVALLSDIHIGPTVGFSKLDTIVKMTNELEPDIVVLAGDLTDATVEDAKEIVLPLKDLTAPLGKYFVTGNHEYHTGDVDDWMALLKTYGFTILHNSNARIYSKIRGTEWLCLLGVDDIEATNYGYMDHGMNLSQAYDGCERCSLSILVAHQPRAAKMALDSDFVIDLVLSGHTHGGQVFPFTIPAYLGNPFFRGLYTYKDSYVYVTQGCVYFGMPLRLFSHTEITELTLVSPQALSVSVPQEA